MLVFLHISSDLAKIRKARCAHIFPGWFSYIFLVVLYGCETLSYNLREEHRLRVFENRMPRRIFGPKRDEVTWEWRKLHNEELNNLQSLPNIIRVIVSPRMSWEKHVTRMEDRRGAYRVLVGKSEEKRPL
jgi:hypothetical protein